MLKVGDLVKKVNPSGKSDYLSDNAIYKVIKVYETTYQAPVCDIEIYFDPHNETKIREVEGRGPWNKGYFINRGLRRLTPIEIAQLRMNNLTQEVQIMGAEERTGSGNVESTIR